MGTGIACQMQMGICDITLGIWVCFDISSVVDFNLTSLRKTLRVDVGSDSRCLSELYHWPSFHRWLSQKSRPWYSCFPVSSTFLIEATMSSLVLTDRPYVLETARVACVKSRDMHWALVAHRDQRDIGFGSLRMLIVADGANPCEWIARRDGRTPKTEGPTSCSVVLIILSLLY